MDNKEFKSFFGKLAKQHGFVFDFGGWFKESNDCILTLMLQKSNFSNFYYLNFKIYIQGCFGKRHVKSKSLVKTETGNIFIAQPKEYNYLFDFETPMDDSSRKQDFERFFSEFVDHFSEKALSLTGIRELEKEELIFIPPGTKKSLESLESIGK